MHAEHADGARLNELSGRAVGPPAAGALLNFGKPRLKGMANGM
jgi:hypothetical protein